MKLILKENVLGLGYKDDIVTVKDGYGRNYLIPQQKAVIASKSALKALEEELKQRAHKLAKIKNDAQALADQLANIRPIVIETKVSASGTAYGSVNAQHIADALKAQGFDIDRKIILVRDVKEVGTFHATIKLHRDVEVDVPFTVVAEGAEEPAEEAPAEAAAAPAEAPAAEPEAAAAPAEAPAAEGEAAATPAEAPATDEPEAPAEA